MTYSIKEVSKIFNLSIYTLRYYDKQGLLPFVSKTNPATVSLRNQI
ncbi:hypothetical protein GCM10027614_83770 [Micromonospora vulcania]